MKTANTIELSLIGSVEIPLDTLKAFPFWISTGEMDTDRDYWPSPEPPEGKELASDERWIEFPEDFSKQRLLFEQEGYFDIWIPDWIELSQKHNGLLFIIEGCDDIESKRLDLSYPSVYVHLRFKSELDRMAAINDILSNIQEQIKERRTCHDALHDALNSPILVADETYQDNLNLFFGQYPELG